MKRASPLLLITLFLAGIFILPVGVTTTTVHLQETSLDIEILEHESEPSWLPADRNVRVAIYNESNSTVPSYASNPGVDHNNASGFQDILLSYGYEATLLTTKDISNHKLTTAEYDILALVDNVPRENITNQIKEFWLGGGGLLALDGSAGYLCHFGILPSESEGSDGFSVYWQYDGDDFNVTARHPISKGYEKNQTVETGFGFLAWNWTALQGTSIASDLTMVARSNADSDDVTALAFEPSNKGGKIVTLAMDNHGVIYQDLNQMVADSVDWLCPRPKGRILYDLSHRPHYGLDSWDETVYTDFYFTTLRNTIVNHAYTVDKLYPSASGNLTLDNLGKYDMLILCESAINYTLSEIQAVTDWVDAGGGLVALNDAPYQPLAQQYLNNITRQFGMEMNTSYTGPAEIVFQTEYQHPITEGVSNVRMWTPGAINITGSAYPIYNDTDGNIVVSGSDHGDGRALLFADRRIFANGYIASYNNERVATNVANWLISWDADTILYTDEPNSVNYYRTPVARALNELGMDFYLVFADQYLNLSLHHRTWELIVVDNPWSSVDDAYDAMFDHVEGGGRFVMSSYRVDNSPSEPLWSLLGFQYITEMPDKTELHIWDESHPIFNTPYDYSVANFTPTWDYNDEGDVLGVFPNATALGGNSSSYDVNHSVIVLGNEGRTLFNGYLIDQFQGDLDDSTYSDNFELWLNEIAFVMRPTIDSPSDMSIEAFDTEESITWTPSSDRPMSYKIERNSVEVESASWGGGQITYDLEEESLELVTFELTVYNVAGSYASDTVMVTVVDTTDPSLAEAPGNLEYEEGTTEHLMSWSFSDAFPDSYVLYINGTEEEGGSWDGSELSFDVGGLSVGAYNLTLLVNDTSGNSATSTVYLTVTGPSGGGPFGLPETIFGIDTWIILAAAGVVVVIIILVLMKKR
ncbi:MAG: hypothetical protein GF309_15650 [Candidatus Lokiarchaeota archaeon]|nr:hypothetical protein [Candidatus Lokiarchaeota archaeon]